MKIAGWNVGSLNDPIKQLEVHPLIIKNKVIAIGILEIRVKHENKDKF